MNAAPTQDRKNLLEGLHVLDGGLASELEFQGARIDGPLWSAHVLEDDAAKVVAVHRAYLAAGTQILLTASYQVSRRGYAECGFSEAQADRALLKAVHLARQAAAEFPNRRTLVAASLGPYGAALHNGAEYHGRYQCSFDELVHFHRERIAVLATAAGDERADLVAFETLPSLDEAQAIAAALEPFPELAVWFSFTCRDEQHVAHGEPLSVCAQFAAALPQTVAVGVNCTHPQFVTPLIGELKAATDKPIVVYPNSGEGWSAESRSWLPSPAQPFEQLAGEWFACGAQIVGGCCRTRPAQIRQVAAAAQAAHNL